jgi:citrate lyase subunit beta/citryl-CoA lyase
MEQTGIPRLASRSPAPDSRPAAAAREQLCEARCLLFVPGDRPDRFERAFGSPADAVILDLEASVAPLRKAQARAEVAAALARPANAALRVVRVNPPGSDDLALDAAMLHRHGCDGVLLPMVESAADVAGSRRLLPDGMPLIALVETASGIAAANDIARAEGVLRLAFGNMDYQTDTLTSGQLAMAFPSSALVIAARAAGLPAPIAGVTSAFRDPARLASDLEFEQSLGFGAKLCIHPDQIAPILAAFSVSPSTLLWAERVLAAASDSHAVELDGELIDRPVIDRARRLLARARFAKPG